MSSNTEALAPCPFCGGVPEWDACDRLIQVSCTACRYSRPFDGLFQKKPSKVPVLGGTEFYHQRAHAEAIAAWNRRAALASPPPASTQRAEPADRDAFERAYAANWHADREGPETVKQLAVEVRRWREGNTYPLELPRLRFGWEGFQWASASPVGADADAKDAAKVRLSPVMAREIAGMLEETRALLEGMTPQTFDSLQVRYLLVDELYGGYLAVKEAIDAAMADAPKGDA